MKKHLAGTMFVLLLSLFCCGCGPEAELMDQSAVVDIQTPQTGALVLQSQFVGTISAGQEAQIVPLVAGSVEQVCVSVGDQVSAGQTLARIDDDNARLQLASASAAYNTAKQSAAQTTGASWQLQTMSAQSGVDQLQASIDQYYLQISQAESAIADLEEQIDDLKEQKRDLKQDNRELSDGLEEAQSAYMAATTAYNSALSYKAALTAANITSSQQLQQAALADPAMATLLSGMTAAGYSVESLNDATIAYLAQVYEEAASAYTGAAEFSGGAATGVTSLESAIQQCESAITSYENAIEQYYAALNAAQQSLSTAQQSVALTSGPMKSETQAVLDAQAAAAAVGVSSARQALEYYTLTSPIDGVVTAVNVSQYGLAASGYAAFTVSNTEAMQVSFSVSEAVRATLSLGDSLTVSRSGAEYPGTITEIANAVDARSGLFLVKAAVNASGSQLLSGASVTVTCDTYRSGADSLLIPSAALYYEDNQAYVYCEQDGLAIRVFVSVGLYDDETAVITQGLSAGSQVVTSWSPRLREGAPLRQAGSGAEE